jgi:uncharacterized protein YukE
VSMIGANPEDLQRLSEVLDAAGNRMDDLRTSLSRTFEAAGWCGAAAEQFLSDWYQGFLPLLQQIGEKLHGLAARVRFEEDQQLRASSSPSGPVSSGGRRSAAAEGTPWSGLTPIEREVGHLSDTWGPWVGPVLGKIPYVGPVLLDDQVARVIQAGAESHFRAAFDGITNLVAPFLEAHFDPLGVVAGTTLVIIDNDVDAAANINWRETFEHPSDLNPFQPGALSAVWRAEEAGFEKLGRQEVEDGFAAVVSALGEG